MVFFLNADEEVYARYGARDAQSPDSRQSLDGLRYTMQSVLAMHESKEKSFAPRAAESPKYVRQIAGTFRGRRCFHCHQVKEVLNADLRRQGKWERDSAWRYPLPDNLGLFLELHRGNVVEKVAPKSPAAQLGLVKGDVIRRLGGIPVHSLADIQLGLERAPRKGVVALSWERQGKTRSGELSLPEGWRKSDITWRPSMQRLVPTFPLDGNDLKAEEKKALGLDVKQLAFRQRPQVPSRAREAGIRPGDIILGVDDRPFPGMDGYGLDRYVRREYLVGDRVTINVLREGKRLSVPLPLR
jgi:serine protease Do